MSESPRAIPKITLVPLIATTYLMVSGGPYGLEELVQKCGYLAACLVLVVTPIIWGLPISLMVGELSTAIPEEGGFYAWARRALGPFWGFQAAWLGLANSIVDMALYPTLFVLYLSRVWPGVAIGHNAWGIGLAVIITCAAVNISGIRVVGHVSVALTIALLAPIAVLSVMALATSIRPSSQPAQPGHADILGGILIAMWSYSGWDDASTIAGEVDRPQRNYPVVMMGVLVLTALIYALPVLSLAHSGIDPAAWSNGAWVDVGTQLGGPLLGFGILVAGLMSCFAICNALVLSYSRLPLALADDGYLPGVFRRRLQKSAAPWVSIIVCSIAWCAVLPLGFDRLIALDVILYGLCLLLQFVTLMFLRRYEPDLTRPFRVPGGMWGVASVGVAPVLLLLIAIYHEFLQGEHALHALVVGGLFVVLGPAFYLLARRSDVRAPDGGNSS